MSAVLLIWLIWPLIDQFSSANAVTKLRASQPKSSISITGRDKQLFSIWQGQRQLWGTPILLSN
jgi:hypothetical protein